MADFFAPHVEIVMYEVHEDKMLVIDVHNPLSGVKEGEVCHFDEYKFENSEKKIVVKSLPQGIKIKTMQIGLRNTTNKIHSVLELNFDITQLHIANSIINRLITVSPEQGVTQEENVSIERLREAIENYCFRNNLAIFNLSTQEKKAIVHHLKSIGLLNLRSSITTISQILGTTRQTIYNYLNDYAK